MSCFSASGIVASCRLAFILCRGHKEAALETLADSVSAGRNALQEANVLILTPGTARVYERPPMDT